MALSLILAGGVPAVVPVAVLGLLTIATLAWLLRRYQRLAHIPGPCISSLTNIPRLFWIRTRSMHNTYIDLHRKHGDFVRLGPNTVSVGTPLAIPLIYGTGSNLPKSDFYRVLQPMSQGRIVQGLFNTQDEKLHRAMKRPIAGIYSMSNLVSFEPYVDTTINYFLGRLEAEQRSRQHYARAADRSSDLGTWMQYFAFDVMGEITFSRRLGFLDTASDMGGIMADIYRFFRYTCFVGQMPLLDRLWAKNPLVYWLLPSKNSPVVSFALARAQERRAARDKAEYAEHAEHAEHAERESYNARDFLSRFGEALAKDASIPAWFLTAWTTSNILAGSDTTAILLRAIVHFLLTHPASLAKLRAELRQAQRDGRLSASASGGGVVTWKESRELPYLDACVKEAGRLHPPVGLALERVVVAAGGLDIRGTHLPLGTVVGINAWVAHRDRSIFGADADEWNPDRWLGPKDERVAAMERSLLTFGSGHRTCLGKNISLLEIYKLIPTLFARYDMTLEKPEEWVVDNNWLTFQRGLHVQLRVRDETKEGEAAGLA